MHCEYTVCVNTLSSWLACQSISIMRETINNMEKQKSNKIKLKIAKISIEFRFLFFLLLRTIFLAALATLLPPPQ